MPFYQLGDHAPRLSEDQSFFLAPGAHVIGNIRFGADVGVWFGAVIRGDDESISIGDRTNVQDGCVLHCDPGFPLEIGSDCTIGHKAIVHGCTIENNVLIGMGATILNGARIRKNTIVGAGALVTEGKDFPERSLIIGSPAKAIKVLSDEAIAAIENSARTYAAKAKRYLAELCETVVD